MKRLMLAAALMLAALASAHAQIPPGRNSSETTADNNRDALAIRDPIHRDEALIAGANKRGNSLQRYAPDENRHPIFVPTFKAQIKVRNNSAKAIKSVTWSASLIDPGTGRLIRTYDVTSEARIAPGKAKHLSERLPTPSSKVVSAGGPPSRKAPAVVDLKTKITLVTYEDGSTSETP